MLKYLLPITVFSLLFKVGPESFFFPQDSVMTFEQKQAQWAHGQLSEMTLEEKVGQLFMISVYSNKNEAEYRIVESQIKKYHLGGVAFFQGNALKQAELTNRYQAAAKIPLLVGLDAEWGLGMRLNNTVSFPKAITIGASKDEHLAEQIGEEIAAQCKRIGVNINFAPVADINSNPLNPVINYRSFGESKENVANLAGAITRGMQRNGVMASAKHFPGHGYTQVDSHHDLPVLNQSLEHLNRVETVPFKAMIDDSIASVMIGHLNVLALDENIPASVSKKVVTDYLKKDLGFKGLVISDALNMRGLLKTYPVGKAEVMTFKAGVDILLQTANIDRAYNAVLNAVLDGTISKKELDESVTKILKSKYWAGLEHFTPIELEGIQDDINNEHSKELIQKVYNEAVTVSKDDFGLVPIRGIAHLSMASIAVGIQEGNEFQNALELYGNVKSFVLADKPGKKSDWETVVAQAAEKDLVIVGLHKLRHSDRLDYGITGETLDMLRELQEKTHVIVCVFGNPYSLRLFYGFETVVCGYDDVEEAHLAMANALFGINPVQGKIPVNTLSDEAKLDDGFDVESLDRLGFGVPSLVGMDADKLDEIGWIAREAIEDGEFPGCQILVARNGKVVYYEGIGNLAYTGNEQVTRQTIYDLASITKVAATLQSVMMLYDQNKIDLDRPISNYLPELENTNKNRITVREILLHQAGLKAFVPFYNFTVERNERLNPYYFSTKELQPGYEQISSNVFVNPVLKDSVFSWIVESDLIAKPNTRYVYSDLGLILLQRMVEKITERDLDGFVSDNIYRPLGLESMWFNPYKFKNPNLIAPTEAMGDFRKAAIRGTVHDPNAALLGGVAGHAGLFSNAWDLARLMQMDLNGGHYDDHQFFSKETIDYFTRKQSKISHRGLGWNRPNGPNDGSVSRYASDQTYGHTGFTGTCVWVDPEKDLIFVFLSNRVYPSASNNKLMKNKTRQRIHDVVYEAIIN